MILIIGLIALSCECYQKLDPNNRLTFLSRDIGGNNGWATYNDNLLLNKDTAQLLSISEYINVAKKYVDTVKADRIVSSVTFLGITSCTTPISENSDIKDYEVISIVFKSGVKQYANEKTIVGSVWICKQGKLWRTYEPDRITNWQNKNLMFINEPAPLIKSMFDSLQSSRLTVTQLINTIP